MKPEDAMPEPGVPEPVAGGDQETIDEMFMAHLSFNLPLTALTGALSDEQMVSMTGLLRSRVGGLLLSIIADLATVARVSILRPPMIMPHGERPAVAGLLLSRSGLLFGAFSITIAERGLEVLVYTAEDRIAQVDDTERKDLERHIAQGTSARIVYPTMLDLQHDLMMAAASSYQFTAV